MMQMKVPQLSQGYPSDARSSLWQERQIMASRSRRIWRIRTTWVAAAVERRCGRNAQSTSGPTFDNAPRRLQPRREPVGACVLPSLGDWRQTTLFTGPLETQPAAAVFGRDLDRAAKRTLAPLRGATAVWNPIHPRRLRPRHPAVDFPSLRRRRRHHPHFPPLARRVEKGSITHTVSSVAGSRQARADRGSVLHGGCQKPPYRPPLITFFCAANARISRPDHRVSSFRPASSRS